MTDETQQDRIEALKHRLDELRPLSPDALKSLEQWYDVELTYSSNAVEGNTITRSETAIILEKGITVRGKSLKEHNEILGHKDALDYVRSIASSGEPIREMDLREIHRLVLLRADPEDAGRYSQHERRISGSTVVLPSPAEIPSLMGDFSQWLANAPKGYESAFEAHYQLVTIHPFSDGNGRTSRLLMNMMLIRDGYPPVVIGPEHRETYMDALQARQVDNNPEPWREFTNSRLEASLNDYVTLLSRDRASKILLDSQSDRWLMPAYSLVPPSAETLRQQINAAEAVTRSLEAVEVKALAAYGDKGVELAGRFAAMAAEAPEKAIELSQKLYSQPEEFGELKGKHRIVLGDDAERRAARESVNELASAVLTHGVVVEKERARLQAEFAAETRRHQVGIPAPSDDLKKTLELPAAEQSRMLRDNAQLAGELSRLSLALQERLSRDDRANLRAGRDDQVAKLNLMSRSDAQELAKIAQKVEAAEKAQAVTKTLATTIQR